MGTAERNISRSSLSGAQGNIMGLRQSNCHSDQEDVHGVSSTAIRASPNALYSAEGKNHEHTDAYGNVSAVLGVVHSPRERPRWAPFKTLKGDDEPVTAQLNTVKESAANLEAPKPLSRSREGSVVSILEMASQLTDGNDHDRV